MTPTTETHPERRITVTPSLAAPDSETVQIRAHNRSLKRLGPWTTARRFDVRASQSSIVLDLLLPTFEPGEVEIELDIDHSTVKLLVPDGANIDDDDLRRVGRGRVKDWTGTPAPGGLQIRLVGEIRNGEVRVHRGGVAILPLLLSPPPRGGAAGTPGGSPRIAGVQLSALPPAVQPPWR